MPNISYRLEMQAAEAVDILSLLKEAGNLPRLLRQTQRKWKKTKQKESLEVEARIYECFPHRCCGNAQIFH